ncbi:MAG TPA: P-loop NTPase fold protein [Ruminococcus flavefaciens]|nr:P-loop NTPase fold protein [Ruminococcus flavefaciens]
MTYDEMNNYILDYLENDKTGRAIMLSGDWGCGKSYYVKEKLKSFIEDKQNGNYRCVIVSLYGLSDVSEISRAIYFELRTILKSPSSEKGNTGKAIGKMIGKTILNGIGSKIGFDIANINEEDLQEIYESVDLTNKLIVLEDFERTQIDTIKLLGFVNNLCENDRAKILLVANEKKLAQFSFKKTKIPYHGKEKEVTQKVYTDEAQKYLGAKEKTISDTLRFTANTQETVNSIIRSFDNVELNKFIDSIKTINRSIFKSNETNYREVIVACQKSCDIYRFMESRNIISNDEFKKCIFIGLVNYLQKRLDDCDLKFESSSSFDASLSGEDLYPLIRFCYDYYNYQILEEASIKETIEEYENYKIYVDRISYDDPDLSILYSLYNNSATDIDDAIKRILVRLGNIKDISLNHYDRIINSILIYKYDYHSTLSEIDEIINKIISNLKGRGKEFKGKQHLFSNKIMIEDSAGMDEMIEIEKKIYKALNDTTSKSIIPDRNKLKLLIRDIPLEEVVLYNPNELISKLNLSKMIDEISEYEPSVITNLLYIFQRLNYEKLIGESYAQINQFKESIEKLIEKDDNKLDRVQVHNLKWVCTAIENNLNQLSIL